MGCIRFTSNYLSKASTAQGEIFKVFLNSLWFQILWYWFCFHIFDVNQLLFSSLSHITFKLVVRILFSGVVFEMKIKSQSSLNCADGAPPHKDQNCWPLCVLPSYFELEFFLFFLTSNTTKQMLFTSKRDKLSLFCVKRLSPVWFIGPNHEPSV